MQPFLDEHVCEGQQRFPPTNPDILDKLLAADNEDDIEGSRPYKVDQKMTNLSVAATAVMIHDTLGM
jgi:hypothetical protein